MAHRPLAAAALAATLAASAPPPPPLVLTGTIEGTVTLTPRPARRVAANYPGSPGGTHVVGAVPGVAYVVGAVPGHPPAAGPQTAHLAQVDTAFRPALAVIPVGGRVAFPNRDPFFHNVFSYSATRRFDLGRYPRGETRTVTFERPGVAKVYCEIHRWMRSAVVVVQSPFHARIGDNGRFRIQGIPAGRHRLAVWDVDRGERVIDVAVPASGTVHVHIRL